MSTDLEARIAKLEASADERASRQEQLERAVETIVRNLEAASRLLANSLHDLPVLDRRRPDQGRRDDRPVKENRRSG
jgi:hypothetical protein